MYVFLTAHKTTNWLPVLGCASLCLKFFVLYNERSLAGGRPYYQARRQDLAAGGPKTRRGQKPEGGPHFKNTILDVCSSRWAKREMGGHRFQMGYPAPLHPRWRRPCLLPTLRLVNSLEKRHKLPDRSSRSEMIDSFLKERIISRTDCHTDAQARGWRTDFAFLLKLNLAIAM